MKDKNFKKGKNKRETGEDISKSKKGRENSKGYGKPGL